MAPTYKILREFKHDASAKTELIEREGMLRVRKSVTNRTGGLPSFRRLQKQFQWLRAHSEDLRGFIPEIIGSEHGDGYFAYEMTYYDMANLHDMVLTGQSQIASVVLDNVLDFAFERLYEEFQPCPNKLLRNYIDVKMVDRIEAVARKHPLLQALAQYPSLNINGRECINFLPLMTRILASPKMLDLVQAPLTQTVHGDLTAENILGDVDGSFILIDVDTDNIFNSPYLDLSKLMQSFHSNYEFLKASDGKPFVESNCIRFDPCLDKRNGAIYDNFKRRIPKLMPAEPNVSASLLFYEASHFCRMLPYRLADNPDTTPIFYAKAVELLNEFYDEAG